MSKSMSSDDETHLTPYEIKEWLCQKDVPIPLDIIDSLAQRLSVKRDGEILLEYRIKIIHAILKWPLFQVLEMVHDVYDNEYCISPRSDGARERLRLLQSRLRRWRKKTLDTWYEFVQLLNDIYPQHRCKDSLLKDNPTTVDQCRLEIKIIKDVKLTTLTTPVCDSVLGSTPKNDLPPRLHPGEKTSYIQYYAHRPSSTVSQIPVREISASIDDKEETLTVSVVIEPKQFSIMTNNGLCLEIVQKELKLNFQFHKSASGLENDIGIVCHPSLDKEQESNQEKCVIVLDDSYPFRAYSIRDLVFLNGSNDAWGDCGNFYMNVRSWIDRLKAIKIYPILFLALWTAIGQSTFPKALIDEIYQFIDVSAFIQSR
jgi:hypothetical protein